MLLLASVDVAVADVDIGVEVVGVVLVTSDDDRDDKRN